MMINILCINNNNGNAEKVFVEVNKSYNDYLQISSSLGKNDKVIVASSRRLYPNAKVSLEKWWKFQGYYNMVVFSL